MPASIRLKVNPDVKNGLIMLKKRYPFMSPDEILKLALSKLYQDEYGKVLYRQKNKYLKLQKKLKSNNSSGLVFESEDEMSDWWENNKGRLR